MILTAKKHPQIKLHRFQKYEYGHFGGSYIKLTLSVGFKLKPLRKRVFLC